MRIKIEAYFLGCSDISAVDFLRETERVERLVGEQLARVQVHDHQRL